MVRSQTTEKEFSPQVSASCRKGSMFVTVKTTQPFNGAIHVKDTRKKACMALGSGGTDTVLRLSLIGDDDNICGIRTNKKTGQRSVQIAVRIHQTLELADDKFYVITCDSRFGNSRNQTSGASLNFFDDGKKTSELTYGRPYKLRAVVAPDSEFNQLFVFLFI
ncbi:hypothetical protein GQR58_003478 [Nymphon striatum]|nr:hypothetical protein GQR58_003478 [Nymphon striatum]